MKECILEEVASASDTEAASFSDAEAASVSDAEAAGVSDADAKAAGVSDAEAASASNAEAAFPQFHVPAPGHWREMLAREAAMRAEVLELNSRQPSKQPSLNSFSATTTPTSPNNFDTGVAEQIQCDADLDLAAEVELLNNGAW